MLSNKTLLLILFLWSIQIYSQIEKVTYIKNNRHCKIPKNIFLASPKSDSGLTYRVKFTRNIRTEIWGDNIIVIKSKMKILKRCRFETEITKIESKLTLTDSTIYVGKNTMYEIIRSDKNEFAYTYWCNEGRNICTEILERK